MSIGSSKIELKGHPKDLCKFSAPNHYCAGQTGSWNIYAGWLISAQLQRQQWVNQVITITRYL